MSQSQFAKDEATRTITVTRTFNARRSKVWQAWTTKEILDQWWGPAPWRAVTKSLDFRAGGQWLYAMEGPAGERHWSKAGYETVVPDERFTGIDSFCDENGIDNPDFPIQHWDVTFSDDGDGTKVTVVITFDKLEDVQTIINMGFEQGFSIGLDQLERLLN